MYHRDTKSIQTITLGTKCPKLEGVITIKLKQNQLTLIRHLCQFGTLDYQSCLRLLNPVDGKPASYSFRPLTKNRYISKRENGSVGVLAKGRELFPNVKTLITLGGGSTSERVNTISRTASFFAAIGIKSVYFPELTAQKCFVPSTCWRKIRDGILSTVRFTGILFIGEHRLAVYDIGDGKMEWQLRAERSLFYCQFHTEFPTHATGMLLICDDDKRDKVAIQIIRETMYQRKQLIDNESYEERTRPVRYARTPIRVAKYYEHVYLTTPKSLVVSLQRIKSEKKDIAELRGNCAICWNNKLGDFENYPRRYFVNSTTDLLKYVYFFSEAKSNGIIKYSIFIPKNDLPILRMYPKILETEGLEIYEYKRPQNSG